MVKQSLGDEESDMTTGHHALRRIDQLEAENARLRERLERANRLLAQADAIMAADRGALPLRHRQLPDA